MKTNYKIVTSIVFIILVGASLIYYVSEHPQKYVIFALSQNMNAELREAPVTVLKKTKSPKIDDEGTSKYLKKDIKKAVVCCS